ncbi:hypothetical protein DLH72_02435 [Candidatus Gracilibacteria bacterium]|nr:MAG: hypothetical protein DLH72_02435 [Candidatus Gracilibacteria bacterium]
MENTTKIQKDGGYLPLTCGIKSILLDKEFHKGYYLTKSYFGTRTNGFFCQSLFLKNGNYRITYDKKGTFRGEYAIILVENKLYKKGIFGEGDLILRDDKNPYVLWQNYKGKNYNIGNMCYQNYKPEKKEVKEYDLVKCSKIDTYKEKENFDLFIDLNTEICLVKYEFPKYEKPKLKKCVTGQEPGLYYENCCPSEEYDLFMLLKQKVKSNELKTIQDLKNFIKQENEIYEKTKTETQTPKTEINFSQKISQFGFFESIIFSTILLFAYLFRN